ncbi:hypothetical protein EV646_109119 [Kribbella antiqua]|uniref:Integrase-like protein n=1 Tax=Kribbella antiqua TaxID=2512217 RepID=A0A4R2IJY7_9ACTN|nr:hypothetical protein [Kribbella antiqua]TCO44947.1 hypothetical protein EV646_109119 [Kribbella antiqua]
MGHSMMRAALVYQHATEERAREIADRLNELVERETEAAMQEGTPDAGDGGTEVLIPPPRARGGHDARVGSQHDEGP